jgi:hypothetical protein
MTSKQGSKPAKEIKNNSVRVPSVKRLAPVRTLAESGPTL